MISYIQQNIAQGKSELAKVIKVLVSQKDHSLFQLLDAGNDDIFLEPLLFSFFNNDAPSMSLTQILFGYIERAKRPAQFEVFVPSNGVIYLPAVGYLKTAVKNTYVHVMYDNRNDIVSLHSAGDFVPFQFEELLKINGSDVELITYDIPLLNCCFESDRTFSMRRMAENYRCELDRAFTYLKLVYPAFFTLLTSAVKKIVLFYSEQHNSFASIKGHGIAFINVLEKPGPAFFVEDLLHQGGHNIFSALTFNKAKYLSGDPAAPLKDKSRLDEEHRSVYVCFHGLFTEAVMNECMDLCIDDPRIPALDREEFKARTGFILMKFCLDIQYLDNEEFFTPAGWEIYTRIKDILLKVYGNRKHLLRKYNYSNQPYTFSYEKFLALNEQNMFADQPVEYGTVK